MAKIIGKGSKTWKDGSVMNYRITDEGVLYISGSLYDRCEVDIRSKAPFHHVVIEDGVTSIGIRNFKYMEEIEELTLPASVIKIGEQAFASCHNLRKINFSEGLKEIGEEAFDTCDSLVELKIPDSVEKIGIRAFIRCRSIAKLTLSRSLTYLSEAAFAGCSALGKVRIPEGVITIGNSAFESCKSLTSISFPKSLRRIGSYAFQYCDSMPNVILSDKNIKIGSSAFGRPVEGMMTSPDGTEYKFTICNIRCDLYNVSIEPSRGACGDITVPGTVIHDGKEYKVTHICSEAFSGCRDLTSVILPDSILVIGDKAFYGCDWLRTVQTGKLLCSIGERAFEGCRCLSKITISDTIEHVSMDSFNETALTKNMRGAVYVGQVLLYYYGSFPPHSCLEIRPGTKAIAAGALKEQSNLEEVVLPAGIRSIGRDAFFRCTGLKRINIPKSISHMGYDVFGMTPQLKEISLPWKNSIELDILDYNDEKSVYIPKGSMESYKKMGNWKKSNLIER